VLQSDVFKADCSYKTTKKLPEARTLLKTISEKLSSAMKQDMFNQGVTLESKEDRIKFPKAEWVDELGQDITLPLLPVPTADLTETEQQALLQLSEFTKKTDIKIVSSRHPNPYLDDLRRKMKGKWTDLCAFSKTVDIESLYNREVKPFVEADPIEFGSFFAELVKPDQRDSANKVLLKDRPNDAFETRVKQFIDAVKTDKNPYETVKGLSSTTYISKMKNKEIDAELKFIQNTLQTFEQKSGLEQLGLRFDTNVTLPDRKKKLIDFVLAPILPVLQNYLHSWLTMKCFDILWKFDDVKQYGEAVEDNLSDPNSGRRPIYQKDTENIDLWNSFDAWDGIASSSRRAYPIDTPLYLAVKNNEVVGWALWNTRPDAAEMKYGVTRGKPTVLFQLCAGGDRKVEHALLARGILDTRVIDNADSVLVDTKKRPAYAINWNTDKGALEEWPYLYNAVDTARAHLLTEAGLTRAFPMQADVLSNAFSLTENQIKELSETLPNSTILANDFYNSILGSDVIPNWEIPTLSHQPLDGVWVPPKVVLPKYGKLVENPDNVDYRLLLTQPDGVVVFSDNPIENATELQNKERSISLSENNDIYHYATDGPLNPSMASAAALAYSDLRPGISAPFIAPSVEIAAVLAQMKHINSQ
jgi:hypothetical protein